MGFSLDNVNDMHIDVLREIGNIGAGNAMQMKQNGTVMVRMMQAYNTLGFEVNSMVLGAFLQAKKQKEVASA